MPDTKRCPRCATDKPLSAFYACNTSPDGRQGWCKDCQAEKASDYASEANRNARLLRSRARNRAVARLVDAHRPEFENLLAQATREVAAEAEHIARSAPPPPPPRKPDDEPRAPRLRPGPRRDGETVTDRIRVLCDTCATFHDRGHTCPVCEERSTHHTPMRPTVVDKTRARGLQLLSAGSRPDQVATELGQSLAWANALYELWRRNGSPKIGVMHLGA